MYWFSTYTDFVVYWPKTRPGCQNRKCTYVNNRCIRSRNIRIITLTVDGLNECNCDAHKKVDVELLYNSVKTRYQLVWRPDPLVTRCSRERHQPVEWTQGPWLSSPERERNAVFANRVGVNMLQFCSVSNSLSHTTLWNKVEVYFSKRLCRCLYCVVVMIMILHASVYEYTTTFFYWLSFLFFYVILYIQLPGAHCKPSDWVNILF